MDCVKCDRSAVAHLAYAGTHLCEDHLQASVERRVRARIREDNLLPDSASPEDPETWVIGVSGGKDSAVLTQILAETFDQDPRVELVALSIHEGIDGYRDESLTAAETLTADLDIEHVTVSYAEEYDLSMDDVASEDPLDMAPCAYCGVFRRDVLRRYAEDLGADKLLTGHNLDDEAETALMNVLEGDVAQMAKHYDASLGPFPGADADHERSVPPDMVPRAKPLRDVPEKEVALYATLRELPTHMAECPHASRSFRGELQEVLHALEDDHPGTRHSIISGYEELAALAAQTRDPTTVDGECVECGVATSREVCRTCELLAAV
ncbi:MAG: TIGR00269 family protein [Halanaeroarchaeum sp.]